MRLFITSVLLFVLASLLCGLAPNLEMLIAFRVLQGAVAGPMIPLSQALLLSRIRRPKRHGAGHVVDDHHGGAGNRADSGRLAVG